MLTKKIIITTTSFGEYDRKPLEILEEKGLNILLNPYGRKLKKDESIKLCEGALGVIAGTEILDYDILEKLPDLKVISRCGTGMDNVDIKAANRLGIAVFNTPDAPTLAVAELTVGFILNLLRRAGEMDRAVRDNRWEKRMGNLLSAKKVGIIGFGKIGRKVAEFLRGFNCEIKYYDINSNCNAEHKENEMETLDELLKWSDIVSMHVSSKKEIIGEREIKLIKKGGWFINVSRGGVVNEDALYNALSERYLAGAALDVFNNEPYNGLLIKLDNVILTPHIGSYARESRVEMEMQAVKNLLKGLGKL